MTGVRLDQDVPEQGIYLAHVNSPQDARRALLELAERAKSGTYLHLPIWLLVTVSSGLPAISPIFFWCNTVFFGALTASRISLHRKFPLLLDTHPVATVRVGFALMTLPTLQWGMLSAETLCFDSLSREWLPFLFVALSMATAGSVVLAIIPALWICMPLCALAPPTIALLLHPTHENLLLSVMSVCVVAYVYKATKIVHDDYWKALNARSQLEERAVRLEILLRLAGRLVVDRQHADRRTVGRIDLGEGTEFRLARFAERIPKVDHDRLAGQVVQMLRTVAEIEHEVGWRLGEKHGPQRRRVGIASRERGSGQRE